jgi:HEAT repeats
MRHVCFTARAYARRVSNDTTGVVAQFLDRWESTDRRGRDRMRRTGGIPVAALQQAALTHDDPWIRRRCLDVLDHHAADHSTSVFLGALADPVAPVREVALHGLACERCRNEEVCVADVVPRVVQVLHEDADPEVRYKTLPILRDYALRHPAAVDALTRAAESDRDPLLREGARLALTAPVMPSRNDLRRRLGRRGRSMDRAGRSAGRSP